MSDFIMAVDLGGTQMRVACFDSELNLLARRAEPTLAQEGLESVTNRMNDLIASLLPADPMMVRGIGVSGPGPVNPHTGVIVAPPNLPGWHNVPLQSIIQDRFGIATYLGNDANVAALAETKQGAAQGYEYVIYLTVSTGIGSGIIDGGHLVVGSNGLGAEAGHMILVVNGEIADLEQVAAGPAIARQAVARLKDGAHSRIRDAVDGDLRQITSRVVGEAAAEGDELAIELITTAGRMVGLGIVSLMHLYNPQIVVVGGGVTKTGELLFAPMRATVCRYTMDPTYCDNVPIVPAALGDNVALVGAAALVITEGGRLL